MLLYLILSVLWSLDITDSPDTIYWLTEQIDWYTSVHLCGKILLSLLLQPTHYWYLRHLLTFLCNHQILQFLYLYLRPLCLFLSDPTLLLLVLQHSCKHQNFQALATLNFVFAFWTFRLTLQSLQKLLIFPIFLLNIMNLLMFLVKPKLKFLLLIGFITSKSIWKKVLNLQLALYTFFQHLNKGHSRNSLRKTLTWVSSNQPPLHMVY